MPTLSRSGLRSTRLADNANLAFGQGFAFQTRGMLPPGRLVTTIRFVLDAIFTQPAAAAAVQFSEVFQQMIARVNIGRRINMTGLGVIMHEWCKTGRVPQAPGDIEAVLNAAEPKRIEWTIHLTSPRSDDPYAGAVASEHFVEQITGNLATNAIFAATAPTLGNATLYCYLDHVAQSVAPGKAKIGWSQTFEDRGFASLTPEILKPGAYEYAVIYREAANDRGLITDLNLSSVTSRLDGEPLLSNLRGQDAAELFNQHVAATGHKYVGGAGLYAEPGDSIDNQPSQTAGAGLGAPNMRMVPLIVAPRDCKVSQLPRANAGITAELAGTLGAYRIAFGLIEPRSMDSFAKAARAVGIQRGRIRPKTLSKGGLPEGTDLAAYLPAVVEEE